MSAVVAARTDRRRQVDVLDMSILLEGQRSRRRMTEAGRALAALPMMSEMSGSLSAGARALVRERPGVGPVNVYAGLAQFQVRAGGPRDK